MPSESLALMAALLYATGNVAIKWGLRDTSLLSGLLISLTTGFVALVGIYTVTDRSPASWVALVTFAMAGLFGSTFGRATAMAGVDVLGASRAIPLQSTMYPLSAWIIAVVFLSEKVEILQVAGLAALLGGVWMVSSESESRRAVTSGPQDSAALKDAQWHRGSRFAILLPFLAGGFYGLSDIIRKAGMEVLPSALFGALVGTTVSLLFWGGASLTVQSLRDRLSLGRGAGWFVFSGVCTSSAMLATIAALQSGNVSKVSPLVATQPIFVILLTAIFLRKLETLTLSIVSGGVLIVSGGALIAG